MIGLFVALLILAGLLLMAAGMLGIWLAMSSPIQLQPLPLIAFIVGLMVVVIAIGLMWPR